MQLAGKLVKAHVPENVNALERYGVSKDELIKGVLCPDCGAVPKIRKARKLFCAKCNHQSVDAHLLTLRDYRVLISNRISNREARDFLRIESPEVAKKLLQKENFVAVGRTSTRIYIMTDKRH